MRSEEDHLKEFVHSVETVSKLQKKLSPYMGGEAASLVARMRYPRQAYRFFLHSGGYGCTSVFLVNPLVQSLSLILLLLWVSMQQDIAMKIWAVSDLQSFGVLNWIRGVVLMIGLVIVPLLIFVHGLTFFALLKGTILRGLNKEYLKGSVNLNGTGESNFVLKLMGRKPTEASQPL